METTQEINTQVGCLPKVVGSWRNLISTLNNAQQVHPLAPVAPESSEFVQIDPKVQIRVIHVKPEKPIPKPSTELVSKRSSLSEEYWFSIWNKPLKIGNCNCSFRRSMRSSISAQPKRASKLSLDQPTKIVNVETFVERIIQESFFEAFQEFYMKKSKGEDNLAFEVTEDEVVLRNKAKPTNLFRTDDKIDKKLDTKPKCFHKKNQKKPLIFLLHGIGSSADVWWKIITGLASKGYEIVAPDLIGHGYSSAPDKAEFYSFSNLLKQTLAIFDYYMKSEKRKCILIGHSYGCSILSALYHHRASQITQLVLISGGGPTPLAAPVHQTEISPFGCVYTLLRPLFFCGVKRSLFYSLRGKNFGPCVDCSAMPKHILQYILNGQNWPEGDAAFHRRILVPTLLVHGLQDKQVTLVQQCEMERTIPRAFLELIPNAGHLSLLETPEHLVHMIICFLDW